MSDTSDTKVLKLEEGSAFIVVRGGTRVSFNANGGIDIYGNVSVMLHPPVNDDAKPQSPPAAALAKNVTPKKGDLMPEGHPHAGWVYGGISKTNNQPFYIASKDSGIFNWKAAMEFAAKENARVPSDEELNQIYKIKNAGSLKGTFNETGSYPAGWYWSSTTYRDGADDAWDQRFYDGYRVWLHKSGESSLRLVRS